ncbi:hypothetical protein BC829DRAFT_394792 [Chytridium lagenaria]|nr:hypothetical protein BC829DRAFT_394792 [Chytridium lagenaria]
MSSTSNITGNNDDDLSRRAATSIEASQAPLSSSVILNLLADSVSTATQQQDASNGLRSPADLVFATLHAIMISLGFRFRGLGESGSTPSSGRKRLAVPRGCRKVGTRGGGMYAFRYTHPRSAFTFLLKGMGIADRLVIHCLAIEDNRLQSVELTVPTIVAKSATFPPSAPSSSSSGDSSSSTSNPLLSLFASEKALVDLIFKFKKDIVDKVAPNLGKEGYEPTAIDAASSSSAARQAERRRFPEFGGIVDPGFAPPPVGGGFGPRGGLPMGGRNPYGVGDVDLDPFAAAPGIIPPRGGMHPGGGMFVGPDHPMFGGGMGGMGGGGGRFPPGGGGSFLPPGAVPPGARFDPIGPFGPRPGFGGGGMGGGPRGPFGPGVGGGPLGPFGPNAGGGALGPAGGPRDPTRRSDPDFDELLPPGYDNMYL